MPSSIAATFRNGFVLPIGLLLALAGVVFAQDEPEKAPAARPSSEIRLLVRADDMGVAKALNDGCINAYKEGIVRSVEVIVPGPWFMDAVQLLKDNPDLDVGVHLTLTSEWDRLKWRPLTHAPSLVDADGYFFATTKAFVNSKPKMEEVEGELRAQIDMARRLLGNRISHLSTHMGAATATPELKALTAKLAKEYKLKTDEGLKPAPSFGDPTKSSDERQRALVDVLAKLQPGDWLLVEHPGFDTPESLALGHKGYEKVASDRSNIRRAFTNGEVKKIVDRRGIKLIGYKDL